MTNDEVLEMLRTDARSQFASRVWFSPYFLLEATRALLSIEALVAEGDYQGASVWREALTLAVTRDMDLEIACGA
jgi:hypothetical protein